MTVAASVHRMVGAVAGRGRFTVRGRVVAVGLTVAASAQLVDSAEQRPLGAYAGLAVLYAGLLGGGLAGAVRRGYELPESVGDATAVVALVLSARGGHTYDLRFGVVILLGRSRHTDRLAAAVALPALSGAGVVFYRLFTAADRPSGGDIPLAAAYVALGALIAVAFACFAVRSRPPARG